MCNFYLDLHLVELPTSYRINLYFGSLGCGLVMLLYDRLVVPRISYYDNSKPFHGSIRNRDDEDKLKIEK